MDGITIISNYGMVDFFRDKLSEVSSAGAIIGGWDNHNKQYVLSMQKYRNTGYVDVFNTTTFDESVLGWTSLFSYKPSHIFSLNNNYYTSNKGKIYKHYELPPDSSSRGNFYGTIYNSDVTFVFNGNPSMIKNFQTINYEGDSGWTMKSFDTNEDVALSITPTSESSTLGQLQNNLMVNNFKKKESKYYADITNSTPPQFGEVVFGGSSSGVKGFYGKVKMEINNSINAKKELFAVSTGFVRSS